MNTPPNITKIERMDDIPLLLAQMEKMKVAQLLDKYFPMHGNWQGLSLGQTVVIWLAYVLSEGDHRLNSVQGWAAGLLITLKICLRVITLRELDFSDDRLCTILDHMGRNDDAWDKYDGDQSSTTIRVYNIKSKTVRIDSTTAKSYVTVTDDGMFQFGHSKEHRPDLPQLKINMAVLDPLGLPLSTTIVSGECADDPLYVPEIRKVQAQLGQHGLLYVGDCKMSALATRAYIAASHDFYLCPLTTVQMPNSTLQDLLSSVWTGEQQLYPVHRTPKTGFDKPKHIANGFSYTVTVKANDGSEWQEQHMVVQSLKHAEAQRKALDSRLKTAEQEIIALNQRGRGRKHLNEQETRAAVDAILKNYDLANLLIMDYKVDKIVTSKRAYRDRPAQEIVTENVHISVSRNATAYDETVRGLGWRVYACNDLQLGLEQAVLAYREQYLIEHGFSRLRGKILGLTPLFLSSGIRIKGLIRLLSIGLRVLCLTEFAVREALCERSEKLNGIYAGNPKRATARPTTEMMLRAFVGIAMVVITIGGIDTYSITPLNPVQSRILDLAGFPATIYQWSGEERWRSSKSALEISEP